jgi:hypothetical protein
MSAQETPDKAPAKRAPKKGTRELAEDQAERMQEGQDDAFKDPSLEEQIEVLVPYTGSKIWIIGRPAEHGGSEGKEDGYESYTQSKLGFIEMQMFFSLCSRALLKAVKEGGDSAVSELSGMWGGGDIRAMSRQLQQQDFNEAANFMSMAFALVSYVPDFLVDSYMLWLRVPEHQQYWFKREVSKPYDPDNKQYGLPKSAGYEMVERFLDQNYEEIRDFFVTDIPKMIARVKQLEDQRKAKEIERGSDSPPSKQ